MSGAGRRARPLHHTRAVRKRANARARPPPAALQVGSGALWTPGLLPIWPLCNDGWRIACILPIEEAINGNQGRISVYNGYTLLVKIFDAVSLC